MEKKLEELTNAELKRMCKDKGIATGQLRNKAELLAALTAPLEAKGEEMPVIVESPLEDGLKKPEVYLGKCPKTGKKLYR